MSYIHVDKSGNAIKHAPLFKKTKIALAVEYAMAYWHEFKSVNAEVEA